MTDKSVRIVIAGAGFAGLNAAKTLGNVTGADVTVVDRNNHHLFQPLLYQVAMAALSPADIASPVRSILNRYKNVRVLQGEIEDFDLTQRRVKCDFGDLPYDYLIVATGAKHAYFGHNEWEEFAPGLKTIEQATEIRRRVLFAFERAEREPDPEERQRLLSFVVVGGGPSGVEMAGAIGEMSRYALAKDFRNINPRSARVLLFEGGPRLLSTFPPRLSQIAKHDLEVLGVDVATGCRVVAVDETGVETESGRVSAATVLWAAGVQPSHLGSRLESRTDATGHVRVGSDLSLDCHPEVFVAGDLAHVDGPGGEPLPGIAAVAFQQGRFVGRTIRREIGGRARKAFRYKDKGEMATIGRRRAVVRLWNLTFGGFFAWLLWIFAHIYYLTGFQNRMVVTLQWAWHYVTWRRGARLIIGRDWRAYSKPDKQSSDTR